VQVSLTLADGLKLQETVSLRQPAQQPAALVTAVQTRLARLDFSAGVSEVTLTLANLAPALGEQPALFGPMFSHRQSDILQSHLPELLTRFGRERFYTVELTAPEAHLPEQRFRLRPLELE